MGAGKSTGARSLAAELGGQALDSDRELEQRIGEPIESFFDREGEAAFRAREEEVVCELLARDDGRWRATRLASRRSGAIGVRSTSRSRTWWSRRRTATPCAAPSRSCGRFRMRRRALA
jgi:hypothetical protein